MYDVSKVTVAAVVQEMDMDVQCSVVDLGMYLRSSVPSEESHTSIDGDTVHSDYHALAEQKNYIEELNRKLKCVF